MSELLVLNGACAGTVFFLPDVPTVVGRSPESHLQIADPWISSMHAMFERRADEVWVVDLESRNGTFVGEERVQEAPLAPGTVVRLGRTEVLYDRREASERPEQLLEGRAAVRYLDDIEAELDHARAPVPRRDTARSEPAAAPVARRQLAALAEIGRALVDAPDLSACLQRTLTAMARAVGAERASLLLADDRGGMIPRAVEPAGSPPALSSTVIAAAAQSRAGILTLDAQHDARFQRSTSVIAQGIRSAMCVPLWAGSRVIGMLLFDRAQVSPFTGEDLDLATVVGHQAALAIERARFVERQRVEGDRVRLDGLPPEMARAVTTPGAGDPLALALREGAVLHAAVEGAEALAAERGAPAAAERLRAALDALAGAALAEGGAVARAAGGAVVCVFGLAAAAPDAGARAVRAARAMREALRDPGTPLRVRAAVVEGRVLAGNVAGPGGFELAVLGPAAEEAAALVAVARAGEILVGAPLSVEGLTAAEPRSVGGALRPVHRA